MHTPSPHALLVLRLAQPGDTLTHTRCIGFIEEHVYLGMSGRWMCGRPTRDTVRLDGSEFEVDDISPENVTHINRAPVTVIELLAASWLAKIAKVSARALAQRKQSPSVKKRTVE